MLLNNYMHCAPNIAPITLIAIINTESKGNKWAIGLNHGYHLKYSAHNFIQAVHWVNYLEAHHYNFDIGLGQINIINAHKYGYSAKDMLDPCKNLHVMNAILQKHYVHALSNSSNTQDALYKTISAYNTGNFVRGFHNGYVVRVIHNISH